MDRLVEDIITNCLATIYKRRLKLKYFINCQRRSYTQFKLRLTFTHFSLSLALDNTRSRREKRNRSSSVHNIYLPEADFIRCRVAALFLRLLNLASLLHWFSFTRALSVINFFSSSSSPLFSLELILIVNWSRSLRPGSKSAHKTNRQFFLARRFNVLISFSGWQLNHIFMKFSWHCSLSVSRCWCALMWTEINRCWKQVSHRWFCRRSCTSRSNDRSR